MTIATPSSPLNYWTLPGERVIAGEYPGSPDIAVARAKLTALLELGVTTIIDLTEPSEGLRDYDALLRTLPGGRFVHRLRCPIPDVSITDTATIHRILDHLDVALRDGGKVYLHCWGGIGRTGMIAGCALVRRGLPPSGALSMVERGWRGTAKAQLPKHVNRSSPETAEQMQVVAGWDAQEIARATARGETRLRVIDMNAPPLPKALRPVDPREAERRDRARGCLLGGAIGDALGWPVEFMKLPEILKKYGPKGITELEVNPRTGVAEITDDTQMTMFTAEGLINGRRDMNERGLGRCWSEVWNSYRRWLLTQEGFAQFQTINDGEWRKLLGVPYGVDVDWRVLTPEKLADLPSDEWTSWLVRDPRMYVRRAPGGTCLEGLRTHRPVAFGPPAANNSKGCGGVMRVAPVGLFVDMDSIEGVFDLACQLAGFTHGHPTGFLTAGVFAAVIRGVFEGMPVMPAIEQARAILRAREEDWSETDAAIEQAVRLAASGKKPTAARVAELGLGWMAEEALCISLYCSLMGETELGFDEALRLAVNHDGDSDSTGAMVGQALGARTSLGGLPPLWTDRTELQPAVAGLANDLTQSI